MQAELLSITMENISLKRTMSEMLSILDASDKTDTGIPIEDAIDDPSLLNRWRRAKKEAFRLTQKL